MSDVLQVKGINSKGYGMVPKLVMQDKRLTAVSKAIYAYFCSYAGVGQTAFPSRAKIISDLGLSINTYYKHFGLLKEYGYVKAEQQKTKKGQFKRNLYTLMSGITDDESYNKNQDAEPCVNLPCTNEPCSENQYINNNNTKINSSKIISQSCQTSGGKSKTDNVNPDIEDTFKLIDEYSKIIKTNIEYEMFQRYRFYDVPFVDEIISIIVDTIMSESKYVFISGVKTLRGLVVRRLMELDYLNIEYVINQFTSIPRGVKKKKRYILTMLYNSKLEMNSHYSITSLNNK